MLTIALLVLLVAAFASEWFDRRAAERERAHVNRAVRQTVSEIDRMTEATTTQIVAEALRRRRSRG